MGENAKSRRVRLSHNVSSDYIHSSALRHTCRVTVACLLDDSITYGKAVEMLVDSRYRT